MNKLRTLALAGLIGIIGCGNDDGNKPNDGNTPQNSAPTIEYSLEKVVSSGLAPQADLGVETGVQVNASMKVTDTDNDPVTSSIYLDDKAITEEQKNDISTVINTNSLSLGNHTVAFTATDGKETTTKQATLDVTEKGITVVNKSPTALLNAGTAATTGQSFLADLCGSTDPENATLQYTMNFGDGTTIGPQADCHFNHTYSASGSKTLTGIVSDGKLADTKSKTVNVAQGVIGQAPLITKAYLNFAQVGGVLSLQFNSSDSDGSIFNRRIIFENIEGTLQTDLSGQIFSNAPLTITNPTASITYEVEDNDHNTIQYTLNFEVSRTSYKMRLFYNDGSSIVQATDINLPQSIATKLGTTLPGYNANVDSIYQSDASVNPTERDYVENFASVWRTLSANEKEMLKHYNGDDANWTTLETLANSILTDSTGDGLVTKYFGAQTNEENPAEIVQIRVNN